MRKATKAIKRVGATAKAAKGKTKGKRLALKAKPVKTAAKKTGKKAKGKITRRKSNEVNL